VKGIFVVLRRGVAARRARTLVAGFAVAVAVAFLASTYVLTDTINSGVQSSAAQASASASAVVTDASTFGASLLGGVPTLSASLVTRVRQVPGVTAAEGIAVGYAMPLNNQGHAIASSLSIGISVPADPRLQVLSLRGGSLAGVTIVGFPSSVAAGLLGTGGKYAAIEVASAAGTSANGLAAQVRSAIGPHYTVRTATQQADHIASVISSYSNIIGTLLRVFAIIALLVAALLIANTFAITVAQRARELALLRCVGAARGQAAWSR
jgi:putative ABC transport system permease protein